MRSHPDRLRISINSSLIGTQQRSYRTVFGTPKSEAQ